MVTVDSGQKYKSNFAAAYLTDQERAILERLAHEWSVSRSEVIRRLLLQAGNGEYEFTLRNTYHHVGIYQDNQGRVFECYRP